jgi:ferredoxin
MDQPVVNQPSSPDQSNPSGGAGKAVQKIGKIVVDRELCIGAASCIALAGATFELDEENKAVVKNPKGDTDEEIHAAAVSCPTNAIFLYDEDGNQIYPPK